MILPLTLFLFFGGHSAPTVVKDNSDIEPLKGVNLELYTNVQPSNPYQISPSHIQESPFMKDAKTVAIIHGCLSNGNENWIMRTKDHLFLQGNYNVITVDWEDLAGPIMCKKNAVGVGKYLGEIFSRLIRNQTITSNDTQLVGHGVGAHAAGMAGHEINMYSEEPIARITALDADGDFEDRALAKKDARFVLAIHTSLIGIENDFGHADFYPNGGQDQPGCNIVTDLLHICSHMRVQDLYLESINSHALVGTRCSSWQAYKKGLCNSNQKEEMGYHTRSNATGKYFLQTNKNSPFGQSNLLAM